MITLAGLSGSFLFWGALIGAGFISVLYLLRLRRRQIIVPHLPLWEEVLKASQYRSFFQRLKRLLSWLLQILFWLLLLLALADPKLKAELFSGRTIVLVLDRSASMLTKDEGKSRLSIAKKEAEKTIQSLIGDDRMMLVAMDREALPLTPFTTDKKLLLQRLKELKATDTPAKLRKSLLLAKDALQGQKQSELLVISDGAFGRSYRDLLKPLAHEAKLERKLSGSLFPKTGSKTKSKTGKKVRKQKATDPDQVKVKKQKTKKKRRRRRKRISRKKKTVVIKLPPGMKRQIDVKQFSQISEVHRKLPLFRLIRVGTAKANVGIIAMSARRLPSHPLHFAVYLEIQNYGKKEAKGELELYVDGHLVNAMSFHLGGGKRWQHIFPKLTAQGQKLEAVMKLTKGQDFLAADNRAYAVLPKTRAPSVLLVSNENLYLKAALLSDPHIVYRHIQCKNYQGGMQSKYDIIAFHSCGPLKVPRAGRFLFFDPPEKGTGFRISRKKRHLLKRPLITEVRSDHPAMAYVVLQDVNIASALKIRKERGDVVLASSFAKPLIVARKRGAFLGVLIGFSLKKTDLPWRVAFPLFVKNSLQWLIRGGRPLPPTSYRTGERWRLLLPIDVEIASIEGPRLARTPLPVRDGVAYFSGKNAGFYKLHYKGTTRWLAANLADPEESRILPRTLKPSLLKREKKKSEKTFEQAWTIMGFRIPIPKDIWSYLLIFAVILLSLEWFTYNRRMTI